MGTFTQEADRLIFRWFPFWTSVLLTVFAAGCSPVASATPSLPAPQVWIERPEAAASPTAPPTSTGTAIPLPPPASPAEIAIQLYGDRLIKNISVPSLGISSPVVPVGWRVDIAAADGAVEWDSPGGAVGWVLTSALPGDSGNIILYGHNNMYGSVFRNLYAIKVGDSIILQTGERTREYRVDEVNLLPVIAASSAEAATYQAYLQQTDSPRLTMISCWPPESNTHRVVAIASPVQP
jgi:LPXTG-site transpeptidase (sortase) family protein